MKEKFDKKKEKPPSRRTFLQGAALTAGTAAIAGAGLYRAHEYLKEGQKVKEDFRFLDVKPRPRPYRTGVLAGKRHLPALTGLHPMPVLNEKGFLAPKNHKEHVEHAIPAEGSVDFSYVLAQLWKEKVARMGASRAEEHLEAIQGLFLSYRPEQAQKLDLSSYRSRVAAGIDQARADVPLGNIRHLRAFADFSDAQVGLLRALERRIFPESLLAYSLTEIMPTSGAQAPLGVEVYDWLLRNAGAEYLENGVPSEHDSLFSFGPYQLTPGILHDHTEHPRGAALIELLAHERKLPEHLGDVRGALQHRAAYLYAVHNLALLVRRLNDVRSHELMALLPNMPHDSVTEFIAVAHHNPDRSINVFEKYLFQYQAAVNEPKKYERPDFTRCCESEGDLGPYARKTRDNIRALRAHFSRVKAASR